MTHVDLKPAQGLGVSVPASSTTLPIIIRQAVVSDDVWVEDLHARAFGPGRFARAAFRVREQFSIDKNLSLIAEIDHQRVASIWMTPISLSGVKGFLLGPLATDPNHQNKGAGKALVNEVSSRALSPGEGHYVLLVGDAEYYEPLGFQRTKIGAIQFPGAVDQNRILVHSEDATLVETLNGPISAFHFGS